MDFDYCSHCQQQRFHCPDLKTIPENRFIAVLHAIAQDAPKASAMKRFGWCHFCLIHRQARISHVLRVTLASDQLSYLPIISEAPEGSVMKGGARR
jgi:hypothetical protein